MRLLRFCKAWAIVLACASWVLPFPQAIAASSIARGARSTANGVVCDVALGAGGRLRGQIVDAAGRPLPGRTVVVRPIGAEARRAVSDAQGHFVVEDLRGGACQVASADAVSVCRCWVENTAPPSAVEQLLLVLPDAVERGQRPIQDLYTPVLIGLVVAAAIAIPIAVHNAQKDSPPGS